MKHINLLPWREKRLLYKNRIFGAISSVFVTIGILIVFSINLYIKININRENKDINILRNEISSVERSIREIKTLKEKKEHALKRMSVIEKLQAQRPITLKILQGVVSALPDGVHLLHLSRKENKLTMLGESISNARVSSFMRKLKDQDWFLNANLTEIKSTSLEDKNNFNPDRLKPKSELSRINFRLDIGIKDVTLSFVQNLNPTQGSEFDPNVLKGVLPGMNGGGTGANNVPSGLETEPPSDVGG